MDKFTELQQRITELEKWKAQKEKQQISFPLDQQSITILQKYFMRIINTIYTIGGVGGLLFTSYLGKQDDKEFVVSQNNFIPYTVSVSTNVLTIQVGRFDDDTQVYLSTSDTPPSPLNTLNSYFVINSSGQSFQLAATQAGAAIDITDVGVGNQYIYFF
jgi:hypothetical protein